MFRRIFGIPVFSNSKLVKIIFQSHSGGSANSNVTINLGPVTQFPHNQRNLVLFPSLKKVIALFKVPSTVDTSSGLSTDESKEIKESSNKCAFYACDDSCPHQGASLSLGSLTEIKDFGIVWSHAVICPQHGWLYDMKSGVCDKAVSRDLTVYSTKVSDNNLHICIQLGNEDPSISHSGDKSLSSTMVIPTEAVKISNDHNLECWIYSSSMEKISNKKEKSIGYVPKRRKSVPDGKEN